MNFGKADTIYSRNESFKKDFLKARSIECYRTDENNFHEIDRYHTDNLGDYMEWGKLIRTNKVVVDWQLMDEQTYNNTIGANSSSKFTDYYDKEDLVLVVLYGDPEE